MLYCLCSKNKGPVTAQLIRAFVYAYAENRLSHDTAHISLYNAIIADLSMSDIYLRQFLIYPKA